MGLCDDCWNAGSCGSYDSCPTADKINYYGEFHIHNDVELLDKYPLWQTSGATLYIMQKNKVVWIGSDPKVAELFIKSNEGRSCRDCKEW